MSQIKAKVQKYMLIKRKMEIKLEIFYVSVFVFVCLNCRIITNDAFSLSGSLKSSQGHHHHHHHPLGGQTLQDHRFAWNTPT